jgi:hypothetical protein
LGYVYGDALFSSANSNGLGEYENFFYSGYGYISGDIYGYGNAKISIVSFDGQNHQNSSIGGNGVSFIFRNGASNSGILQDLTSVTFEDSNSSNNSTITISNVVQFADLTNFGVVYGDVQFLNFICDPNGLAFSANSNGTGQISGTIFDQNSNVVEKIEWNSGLSGSSSVASIFKNNGANNSGTVYSDAFFYNGNYNSGGVIFGVAYYQDAASILAGVMATSYVNGLTGQNGIQLPFADILGTGLQ